MERPPAPRWWRLFGGPGSVLPFRGAHRRRRDWRPCPSTLSDRATAGHALAAAAQDPLGCPRPLRGAPVAVSGRARRVEAEDTPEDPGRSEEHTSELQSRSDLVCRL